MLQKQFVRFFIFSVALLFFSCREKDETTVEVNPSQILGTWYDTCGTHYWRTLDPSGECVKLQTMPYSSWRLEKNKLIIRTYKMPDDVLFINYLDAETILFANGKKWHRCSGNPTGYIEANVGNGFRTLTYSSFPHNYFDPSNSTLHLTKDDVWFGSRFTIRVSPIDIYAITTPYQVPASNFTIEYVRRYSSLDGNGAQNMTLEITKVEGKTIEGNFSGKMFSPANTYYPADTIDFAEGKFKILIK